MKIVSSITVAASFCNLTSAVNLESIEKRPEYIYEAFEGADWAVDFFDQDNYVGIKGSLEACE